MIKIFNKFKTLFLAHFGSILLILWTKIFPPENPALSRTTSYSFLATCQNLEIINDTIPRKRPDRRKDRPYIIGSFRLPPEVQKKNCSH